MKANIGTADRAVRIVLGLVILGLGWYFKSWWGLVGILPLLTAIIRFCPAYVPFGIDTCRRRHDAPPPAPPAAHS